MSKEMLNALNILETEKGIKKEVLVAAIEEALTKAYEKHYDESSNVEVVFDQKKGNVKVYSVMKVVEDIYEPYEEITLEQALEVNKGYEIGDDVKFEVTPSDFGRLAAQTAKQIIMQKVREAERGVVYDNFIQHDGEMMTGVVERQDPRYRYVILPGNQEAAMEQNDQMPNEKYQMGDQIKVLVSRVQNETKGPQVFVSRTAPGLVKRLFEAEVPEVFDGTVEIKAIAREAGDRAKVAVYSHNENLDAVGTMVGQRGQRVQAIVNELSGENMDIVEWTEDPAQFIKNALNPAEVVDVIFDPSDERGATVIVPDYQLSLAIGKRGQNARLAARLTNFKIDIKPESERDAVLAEKNNPAPAAVEEDVFADVDVFADED